MLLGDDPYREYLTAGGHRLHHQWLGVESRAAPLTFLHEGLGSIELWRDFPAELVEVTGRRALVYSRYGNGWSDPLGEARTPSYMHTEADILAGILTGAPVVLVGHSDGASIALIYAGRAHRVEGLILIAPHVFVEPETIRAIDQLRCEYPGSEMATKMKKYHVDADRTFWGWNDIWLHDEFATWNLEALLPSINCPILLIQGEDD